MENVSKSSDVKVKLVGGKLIIAGEASLDKVAKIEALITLDPVEALQAIVDATDTDKDNKLFDPIKPHLETALLLLSKKG